MKYILDINERSYVIKCEYYYHVTHGGDCCSHDKPTCRNNKYPCFINIEILNPNSIQYKWRVIDNDIAEDLMDRIDTNDLRWAIQNLQSDSTYKKVVAKYIVDNN